METPFSKVELEGRYANTFNVGFNSLEFLIEFGQLYSESGPANMHTRIVTSPAYAKALSELIRKAVDDYQEQFAAIPEE